MCRPQEALVHGMVWYGMVLRALPDAGAGRVNDPPLGWAVPPRLCVHLSGSGRRGLMRCIRGLERCAAGLMCFTAPVWVHGLGQSAAPVEVPLDHEKWRTPGTRAMRNETPGRLGRAERLRADLVPRERLEATRAATGRGARSRHSPLARSYTARAGPGSRRAR
jgi:hypothetical protein